MTKAVAERQDPMDVSASPVVKWTKIDAKETKGQRNSRDMVCSSLNMGSWSWIVNAHHLMETNLQG